jgi:hypothetical protein
VCDELRFGVVPDILHAALLGAMLDEAPVGVIVYDRELRIVSANRALERNQPIIDRPHDRRLNAAHRRLKTLRMHFEPDPFVFPNRYSAIIR